MASRGFVDHFHMPMEGNFKSFIVPHTRFTGKGEIKLEVKSDEMRMKIFTKEESIKLVF